MHRKVITSDGMGEKCIVFLMKMMAFFCVILEKSFHEKKLQQSNSKDACKTLFHLLGQKDRLNFSLL